MHQLCWARPLQPLDVILEYSRLPEKTEQKIRPEKWSAYHRVKHEWGTKAAMARNFVTRAATTAEKQVIEN